ncbi:MAG: class I SAM-dependent methyltransferase [Candidatus Eremiobacteraeota bacterium]|nr:class I SAM-dependent methyltransferase [Candidatus Eremiobacteraeota bacterium]
MHSSLELKPLRRRVFSHPWPIDDHLTQIVRGQPGGWQFLANPSGQLPYQYLAHYVTTVASHWFVRPLADLRMLDWGAGKGHFTYLLREAGAEVTPADVNPAEGEKILGRVEALDHPYRLPFAGGSFDVVISMGVLEHVPQEVESLKEIQRVLRPGGLFFCFNLPYHLSWVQWAARLLGNHYHDRFYGRRQTQALLTGQNFQILDLWLRQLFPKNRVWVRNFRLAEQIDQWLVDHTPLGLLATSLEFVALRP